MMNIKNRSYFKNEAEDKQIFQNWVDKLERVNGKNYDSIQIETTLGTTQIYGLNTEDENLETLVIFPGARTTALIWDFDNNLENLKGKYRIYLVETNGLPNLSDGNSPDIKSLGYGEWAAEVFEKLNLKSAFVAGASFGGLICLKLSIVAPEKIKAAFLLNPGCLQSFSLSPKNLYYNLLPILLPKEKNIAKFLDAAIFCKPHHQLSEAAEKLLIDYELFALTHYKDNTQKPYDMGEELRKVSSETYLLVGDKDLLFPYQNSLKNAKEKIKLLKESVVFENVGHGIETFGRALQKVGEIIKTF
ncbi:MAG TPA: acyl-CoA thioester hydrolase/BAAT C-terminal domain-containing protein [Pyrinomonadaceae bacterium]|nr:acyl-CoA thioester hydrolase/BAAT C-terminal domain-containing protein [Pyrinomonadaceae bacterium]